MLTFKDDKRELEIKKLELLDQIHTINFRMDDYKTMIEKISASNDIEKIQNAIAYNDLIIAEINHAFFGLVNGIVEDHDEFKCDHEEYRYTHFGEKVCIDCNEIL